MENTSGKEKTDEETLKSSLEDKIPASGIMTVPELVALCVRLQPVQAAQDRDSSLCVSPLITHLIVDGAVVSLEIITGRWGAGYTRVSDEIQRAAASRETRQVGKHASAVGKQIAPADGENGNVAPEDSPANTRNLSLPDGFSEEEQLTRQIRHFIRHKLAFKIYSDCGVTGEYPTDDPLLIARLLEAKASRYEKIFTRTLLDETSLCRRTVKQVASMRAYLANRLAEIRRSGDGDMDAKDNGAELLPHRSAMGRPRKTVYFRQAFTQLWRDIAAGKVHTLAVSDRSRLCRAADLETEFLRLLAKQNTRLVGLIEDLSSLDVSDPLKKGFTFLIASVNEYRLEEVAGHAFRGTLQLLESGHPCGRVPWWFERDRNGFALLIPERAALVRRIVEMSLAGLGLKGVSRKLHEEGVRLSGVTLNASTIAYTLTSDALIGIQHYFGLEWSVYPAVIDRETYAELCRVRGLRDAPLGRLHDRKGWAEHLCTGILFCAVCNGPLSYNQPSCERAAMGDTGYYLCKAAHKTSRNGQATDTTVPHHACLSGVKIEAFFAELLQGSPHLLKHALTSGNERMAQVAAQRALVEEALQSARAQYTIQEEKARAKAREMTLAMGLSESGAGFVATVSGICASLMEQEAVRLAEAQERLRCIDEQGARDTQASRALAAVDSLQEWNNLDALSRNRLLRALFRVTVYPMPRRITPKRKGIVEAKVPGECGYLEIHLAGVDTPLAPAWMRRGPGKGIRLPTMAEWIADILDETAVTTSTNGSRDGSRQEITSADAQPF